MAVEMGVDPQQADRRPDKACHAAPGTNGDRVIAAKNQRKRAGAQRFADDIGQAMAKLGDPAHSAMSRRILGKKRWSPVEQWMVFDFMPSLRAVEGHRPIRTAAIAGPDAAGGPDDANSERHDLPGDS
jgi:hypothetical protein